MDAGRFDGLSRLLGKGVPRRAVVSAGAAGWLAGAATLVGGGVPAATAMRAGGGGVTEEGAGCHKLRRRCSHDTQCCSLTCRRGRCRR